MFKFVVNPSNLCSIVDLLNRATQVHGDNRASYRYGVGAIIEVCGDAWVRQGMSLQDCKPRRHHTS